MPVYDLDALGVQHGHLVDKFNKLIAVVSVDAFNDLKATVQKIEQELQDLKKKQHVDKNIVDGKGFSGLPVYGGQAEKWDD